MSFIKNSDTLASTPSRKVAVELMEAAFTSIQPKIVLEHSFVRRGDILKVGSEEVDVSKYKRVFIIGFGKGAAGIAQIVEQKLEDKVTDGYVIDTVEQQFNKIHFTMGTHPLPSQQNVDFTKMVLEKIHDLTEEDLVIIVICGGGSAMFEAPYKLELPKLKEIFDTMLKSGANISEMNVIRKHLSKVKGGGLAKHLYPAKVMSLIFSDVPGNDLSTIASGPTVKNTKTMDDAMFILEKYDMKQIATDMSIFIESPQEDKYFAHVSNIIMLSNKTALEAMQERAKNLGYTARIYSDHVQGNAKDVGKILLDETKKGEILLAAGETTIKVKGTGKGGRNQTLVLSAMQYLDDSTVLVSFDSDGTDFFHFAGALADRKTAEKAAQLGLAISDLLDNDDSYTFFEKTGDGVFTDKLESNVADLYIVLKI